MGSIEIGDPNQFRLTRRGLFAGAMLLSAILLSSVVLETSPKRPEIMGTTYSPQFAEKTLRLNPMSTFKEILADGYDVVRLCTYWPEIQPERTRFAVSDIENYLNEAAKTNVRVVLTVGMKSPRYPEVFIPGWIARDSDTKQNAKPLDSDASLAGFAQDYVFRMVEHFKDHPAIDRFQIENEPFNQISVANFRYLSENYIQRLVSGVRNITDKKIILTNSIPLNPFRLDETAKLSVSAGIADFVGKNVYIRTPNDLGGVAEAGIIYFRQLKAQKIILDLLKAESLVAEIQFEPWMVNGSPLPGTDDPKAYANLVMIVGGMGYREAWIWGSENAKKQQQLGNPGYDNRIKRILAA